MTDRRANSKVDEKIFVSPNGRNLFVFSVILLFSGFLVLWFNLINLAPFLIIGAYILIGVSLFI